jgi:hypothetical protein
MTQARKPRTNKGKPPGPAGQKFNPGMFNPATFADKFVKRWKGPSVPVKDEPKVKPTVGDVNHSPAKACSLPLAPHEPMTETRSKPEKYEDKTTQATKADAKPLANAETKPEAEERNLPEDLSVAVRPNPVAKGVEVNVKYNGVELSAQVLPKDGVLAVPDAQVVMEALDSASKGSNFPKQTKNSSTYSQGPSVSVSGPSGANNGHFLQRFASNLVDFVNAVVEKPQEAKAEKPLKAEAEKTKSPDVNMPGSALFM